MELGLSSLRYSYVHFLDMSEISSGKHTIIVPAAPIPILSENHYES